LDLVDLPTGRTVLVAVDFSASSRLALEGSIPLGHRLGARLLLVHAWNPGGWVDDPELAQERASWLERARESARKRLEEWADFARAAGLEVETLLEPGRASQRIPALAESRAVALVVLGSQGRAGLDHASLGSVSERVVRLGRCPVLVIPRTHAPLEPPRRMLVGIDFSRGSRQALDTALELARALGCARGLLLAHAHPGERETWLESWSELAYQKEKQDKPWDAPELERWVPPASPVPCAIQTVEGRAELALLELARAENCDWIVVGKEGHGLLASLLLGSTTDRVLKLTDRPVLVVPTPAA
jgi:nucleotide-binding universal stress UspA family protein